MDKVRFAVIGLGNRGFGLLKKAIMPVDGVEIVGVCDIEQAKVDKACTYVGENGGNAAGFLDWQKMLDTLNPDAALIATGWDTHIPMAIYCMEKGIVPAVEVCGAYCEKDCRDLVDTYERTGTRIMFMENCCFNKGELLATSLARNGVLGDIVFCTGSYSHDLRKELSESEENRHYRLDFYRRHNCDNYPTHDLGPIAKLLNINRGNRMVSLVSVSGCAKGLNSYAEKNKDTVNPHRIGEKIMQGDIVNTIITCENGETISLRLDTTLPRFYNREFTVRGTNGLYEMGNNIVFLDGMSESFDTLKNYKTYCNNGAEYGEKYLPEEWKIITEQQMKSGHGGMDGIEFREFFRVLRSGEEMPIDVYDMASWLSITYLSEISVRSGGAPQEIPDFTRGKYRIRPPKDVLQLPLY